MSLSEREQQALRSIECELANGDPRLASMLATFTRLTVDEALPTREHVGTAPGSRRHRCVPPRRVRLRWQHALGPLWLTSTVALIAVALIIGHGNGRATCARLTISCARQAPRHATELPRTGPRLRSRAAALPGFRPLPPQAMTTAAQTKAHGSVPPGDALVVPRTDGRPAGVRPAAGLADGAAVAGGGTAGDRAADGVTTAARSTGMPEPIRAFLTTTSRRTRPHRPHRQFRPPMPRSRPRPAPCRQ